jgi:DNA polymerase-3 subunit delta
LLYLLYGNDDFSCQERLAELKRGWGEEEWLALNTTSFQANKLNLNQLLNAVNAIPFLGQKRLVIVEGLLGLFEGRPTAKSEAKASHYISLGKEWQNLNSYVAKMPPSTELVLLDGKLGKNNFLLKRLAKIAQVEEFSSPKGVKLQQWIYSRIAKQGGGISPRAVRLLAEFSGQNLWALSNEIEKLLLYTKGSRIDEKEVQLLTTYAKEANIFAMVDAIMEKNASLALHGLHQLIEEGMAPPYLLAMITRQARLIIQVKEIDGESLTPAGIITQLRLSPFYPVERLLKQAERYSIDELVQIYQRLLATDLEIKRGKGEIALDLLIAELCQENLTKNRAEITL